jgi:hypothetical protein
MGLNDSLALLGWNYIEYQDDWPVLVQDITNATLVSSATKTSRLVSSATTTPLPRTFTSMAFTTFMIFMSVLLF